MLGAQRLADAEHVVEPDAVRAAPPWRRRGSPGRRPAGRRTGSPSSITSAPGVGRREPGGPRGLQVGKAAHQVGHERGPLPVAGPRRRRTAGHSSSESTSARSLSPRPDSVTRSSSDSGFSNSQAIACAGSSAGTMPSRRATSLNAAIASRVGDRVVDRPGPRRAATRAVARSPGSRARPTRSAPRAPGRRRPGGRADSAPCRTPRAPVVSGAPWRPESSPSPPASMPTSCTSRVVEEAGERADRVGPAADAGDHALRAGGRSTSSTCARASSPITRWRSRTSAGYGAGPTAEPMT